MGEDGDDDAKKKMDQIQQDLDEKEEEFEYFQNINQNLIIKERRTNDEVQDARKELINVFIWDFEFSYWFLVCAQWNTSDFKRSNYIADIDTDFG